MAPASSPRPLAVRTLAILGIIGGVLAIVLAAFLVFGDRALAGGSAPGRVMAVIVAAYGVIGALQLAAGIGSLGLKPRGRRQQIGLAIIGLLAVGIGATIAIPRLLRARVSVNELAALADLRSVMTAEQLYSTYNMGFPDSLECLLPPGRCIPGYPDAPNVLDATFARPTRHGYRFRFEPGSAAPSDVLRGGQASPSSLIRWAYVAEPVTVGETGVRAFCADASTSLCASLDGRIGQTTNGTCPATCQSLY